MTEANFFCSDLSLASGETLPGTASRDRIWLMLEYNGPWQPKAFEGSELPETIKARLSGWLESIPGARILLIRQPPADQNASLSELQDGWTENADAKFSFFVAVACESEPALYGFWMNDYQELLSIDMPELLEGRASYEPFRIQEPLFLVCTHGRRDRCCARNGIPVYQALSETARRSGVGRMVWQTSHVGGHRLSANLVSFPHAIYHGRVEPSEVPMLFAAVRGGEMYLEKARGRACYDEPVQAAEIFLREKTGEPRLGAYRLAGSSEVKPGEWVIEFVEGASGPVHRVRVGITDAPPVYQGCNSSQPKPVPRYSLIAFEQVEGGRV